jgi:fatty acid desaturase
MVMKKILRSQAWKGLFTVCTLTAFLYLLTLIPASIFEYKIIIGIITIIFTIFFPAFFYEFKYSRERKKQKTLDFFLEKDCLSVKP